MEIPGFLRKILGKDKNIVAAPITQGPALPEVAPLPIPNVPVMPTSIPEGGSVMENGAKADSALTGLKAASEDNKVQTASIMAADASAAGASPEQITQASQPLATPTK